MNGVLLMMAWGEMDFRRRTRTRVFVFYFSKVQYYIKDRRRGRTSLGSSFTCGLSSVERSTSCGKKKEVVWDLLRVVGAALMFHDIFTGELLWNNNFRRCLDLILSVGGVVVRELIRGQLSGQKPPTLKIRKCLFLNVLVTNYSRKYLRNQQKLFYNSSFNKVQRLLWEAE